MMDDHDDDGDGSCSSFPKFSSLVGERAVSGMGGSPGWYKGVDVQTLAGLFSQRCWSLDRCLWCMDSSLKALQRGFANWAPAHGSHIMRVSTIIRALC